MRYTRCSTPDVESFPPDLITEPNARSHLAKGGGLVFVSGRAGGAVIGIAFEENGVVVERGYHVDRDVALELAEQLIRSVRRSKLSAGS